MEAFTKLKNFAIKLEKLSKMAITMLISRLQSTFYSNLSQIREIIFSDPSTLCGVKRGMILEVEKSFDIFEFFKV